MLQRCVQDVRPLPVAMCTHADVQAASADAKVASMFARDLSTVKVFTLQLDVSKRERLRIQEASPAVDSVARNICPTF